MLFSLQNNNKKKLLNRFQTSFFYKFRCVYYCEGHCFEGYTSSSILVFNIVARKY